jgi:hypothetical protein
VLTAVSLIEVTVGRLDGELAAVRHGVARVEGEIEHGVLQLIGINVDEPRAAGKNRFGAHRFADGAADQLQYIRQACLP